MNKKFDTKFGIDYISQVPTVPGVYRFYNSQKQIVYIGKAKNLRRRLSQYRNAKRRKKSLKMRTIVAEASFVDYEVCATDLDALLLENQLIQIHRPKWNIAGAFYFMYPLLGYRCEGETVEFCWTTQPDQFGERYIFHGAYRSRQISIRAFLALKELLKLVARPLLSKKKIRYQNSYIFSVRGLDATWMKQFDGFLSGRSFDAMESLVLALVESSEARRRKRNVQELLIELKRFWRHEARPLMRAISSTSNLSYPLSQRERDRVFLKYRARQYPTKKVIQA